MDEEKQKDGFVKKTGDKLKAVAKNQAKNMVKQVFKKIIMAIMPILLKFLVVAIIVAVIVTAFLRILNAIKGINSKEADAFAVDYSYNTTDDSQGSKIIVNTNNTTKNGVYELSYVVKDDEGLVITEETNQIETIKNNLLKENSKLDLSQFSDSELKVIGVLMYNGLRVDKYNEEELKALAIFVKADIAGQSFDLRKLEEIGKEIKLKDVRNSDEIFGTIQVHRTKVELDEGGNTRYNEVTLEYIPYGDENTVGTFCYMVAQKDLDVINKFSIDEEGNLVIAKWSTTTTNHTYKDKDGNELSEEDKNKISDENIKEDKTETFITAYPIEYKQYITKYVANYGLLSDLLVVTDNVKFCTELAELAFNSKIVINIKEEIEITDTTKTTNYVQTTLLYDYVKYEVYGQEESTTNSWENVTNGSGNPSDDENLKTNYGWNSSMKPVSVSGGSSGGTSIYEWTYNSTNYRLQHTTTLTYSNWVLYRELVNTTYENITLETNTEEEGDLINKEEYEGYYTIDEDYTDEEIFEYKIITKTYSERNTYDFEISEVDTWYIKYKKEYNAPTKEPTFDSPKVDSPGQFPEELTQMLNTKDSTTINADKHVSNFINKKIDDYKNQYENIQCSVTELTTKQRTKTDIKTDPDGKNISTTTTYKFGEENADTTEIGLKNVEYIDNIPTFTKEDGNGNSEIGFLYIYDSYRSSGIDLYLEDDAENTLFELLESDSTTISASDVIKYLLYVYDEIDRGVKELDISIFKPKEWRTFTVGSAIQEWLKSYEFENLREFRNGNKTYEQFQAGYRGNAASYDEEGNIIYHMYKLNARGDNSWNFSYGLRIWDIDTNTLSMTEKFLTEANLDLYELKEEIANTPNDSDVTVKGWDGDTVDKLMNIVIDHHRKTCKEYFESKGITLENYELDAFVAIAYHHGNCYANAASVEILRQYKEGKATKEQLIENFSVDGYNVENGFKPFVYDNSRTDELIRMFFEGRYILSTGEEINPNFFYGSGNITTEKEAQELEDYFTNEVLHVDGTFSNMPEMHNNWEVYNNLPEEFKMISRQPEGSGYLQMFQCTWWANGRANMYLAENGTKYTKYPTIVGNGGEYYQRNIDGGWFNYGSDPKPNSIGCWPGNPYGHVFYVEGVTDEGIWISDCGSGENWYGVRFLTWSILEEQHVPGYIYLDEPL